MYTFNAVGTTAEFWFNDVDEWEIAYSIKDIAEAENICSIALTVDYKQEIDAGELDPDQDRWMLLVMDVTDMARLEAIAQEEWCYYEQWLETADAS